MCNCTLGSNNDILERLIQYDILTLFADGVANKETPSQVLLMIIEALSAMCSSLEFDPPNQNKLIDELFVREVIANVEKLQTHENDSVYQAAYTFITSFIPIEKLL